MRTCPPDSTPASTISSPERLPTTAPSTARRIRAERSETSGRVRVSVTQCSSSVLMNDVSSWALTRCGVGEVRYAVSSGPSAASRLRRRRGAGGDVPSPRAGRRCALRRRGVRQQRTASLPGDLRPHPGRLRSSRQWCGRARSPDGRGHAERASRPATVAQSTLAVSRTNQTQTATRARIIAMTARSRDSRSARARQAQARAARRRPPRWAGSTAQEFDRTCPHRFSLPTRGPSQSGRSRSSRIRCRATRAVSRCASPMGCTEKRASR